MEDAYAVNVRRTSLLDAMVLADWISKDPYHQDVRPEFFLTADSMNLCFEDNHGPVFFLKLFPVGGSIRIYIQFGVDPIRTARMLENGFPIVKECCRQAHANRMVFDSVSPKLVNFCVNRFGFHPIDGTQDLELSLEN